MTKLLPIEENLRNTLKKKIAILEKEGNFAQEIFQKSKLGENIFKGYRQIILDIPLRWRDDFGWPKLLVFSLNSPKIEFIGGYRRPFHTIKPPLPKFLKDCYEDILSDMKWLRYEELAYYFVGYIPQKVKENIKEAEKVFGHRNIFLVGEVDGKCVTKSDPLIIGIHDGKTWLIDTFDVTPLENIVKSEFSV